MAGFKKGVESIASLKQQFGAIEESSDEYIAYVLGALASVYNSIEDQNKLWCIREKLWRVEEHLGESKRNKV